MLAILVTWAVVASLLTGVGLAAARLVTGPRPVHADRVFVAFWLGYATVIGLLQLWHFVLPIQWPALVVVAAAGLGGLAWSLPALGAWVRGAVARRRRLLGVITLAALWLANLALGPGDAHDSGLYHYSVIDWSRAFPLVPGLGNLSPALSLNNSSLLFTALLDVGPWSGRVEHVASGQLLVVLAAQAITAAARLPRRLRGEDVFAALLLVPVVMLAFSKEMTSPKTDLPQALVLYAATWAMIGLLARRDADDAAATTGRVVFIATMAATAVCLKLSAATFAAAAGAVVLVAWWRGARPSARWARRGIAWSAAWGVLLVAPWAARNVVMNGYPLYPGTALPVDVEWRVPEPVVTELVGEIRRHGQGGLALWVYESLAQSPLRFYARLIDPPYDDRDGVRGLNWVRPWFFALPASSAIEVVLPALVALGAGAWVALVRLRRRGGARGRGAAIAWALLPPLAGVAFWLWASPEPRYAYGMMWALAGVAVAAAVESVPLGDDGARRRGTRLLVLIALLLVPTIAYRAAVLRVLRTVNPLQQMPFRAGGPDRGLHPLPTPELTVQQTRWGLALFVPTGNDTQCWRSPLPCIGWPPFDPDLRLRVEGDLGRGFVIDRGGE